MSLTPLRSQGRPSTGSLSARGSSVEGADPGFAVRDAFELPVECRIVGAEVALEGFEIGARAPAVDGHIAAGLFRAAQELDADKPGRLSEQLSPWPLRAIGRLVRIAPIRRHAKLPENCVHDQPSSLPAVLCTARRRDKEQRAADKYRQQDALGSPIIGWESHMASAVTAAGDVARRTNTPVTT